MAARNGTPHVAATDSGGRHFDVSIDATAESCLGRLEHLAEIWGGSYRRDGATRGRLTLPVRAGVRRGVVDGTLSLLGSSPCRIRYAVEDRLFRVQYSAFVFLLLGALGGLVTLVAPWAPRLLPLMPIGIIMAVGAWFFIVAQLTNSGPEEFFGELTKLEDTDAEE